jgi:hypothetical protein
MSIAASSLTPGDELAEMVAACEHHLLPFFGRAEFLSHIQQSH